VNVGDLEKKKQQIWQLRYNFYLSNLFINICWIKHITAQSVRWMDLSRTWMNGWMFSIITPVFCVTNMLITIKKKYIYTHTHKQSHIIINTYLKSCSLELLLSNCDQLIHLINNNNGILLRAYIYTPNRAHINKISYIQKLQCEACSAITHISGQQHSRCHYVYRLWLTWCNFP